MELSAVIVFLVVFGFSDIQAGPNGPTLADRVAVMEEEIKTWKIVTDQAKTKRNTLARRMTLAFAQIDSLKLSLQKTKTQLKEITQELKHVRRERNTYSNSLRKLRDEMTGDVRALQQRLNLTNEDLFATKQQITGLTEDLMTLNMTCCGMRKEPKETAVNGSRPAPLSLAQMAFTIPTTMYPGTTAVSTHPSPNNTVPPAPVTAQDLQASTTDVSENLTPSKTVPPAAVTTQDSDPDATPSPATDRDFYLASRDGDLDSVKRILAAGHVNINTRGGRYNRTPVMAAAMEGHRDVVEFLVGRGADVSLVDGDDANALHMASLGGVLEIVKLILSLNVVDINSRGYYSKTPVMAAAGKGHSDVVEFLVGRGADLSLVDRDGDNVLHWACIDGDVETVKLILSLNVVDINARNKDGRTAADWARYYGRQILLDLLVSRGAH